MGWTVLAVGAMAIAAGTYTVFVYVAGHSRIAEYLRIVYVAGSGEVAIFTGAVVGAALGFLWFNCHPAQVFMGDVGVRWPSAAESALLR